MATVDVGDAPKGQRGLLGLVARRGPPLRGLDPRVPTVDVVVGQVAPGSERLVWTGPKLGPIWPTAATWRSTRKGRILIGIGDLLNPKRIDDADAVNGKILALDPDGQPSQEPRVLSAGWNNPYAFTVLANGDVWVADNSPGGQPERLGRGDGQGDRRDLPGERAPSALLALGPDRLGLCGYLDSKLVEVDVSATPTLGDTLAKGSCRTGAAALGRGRVAVTDGKQVRILRP